MEYKFYNVVGLMTGTSMDGIDISLVKTNGIELIPIDSFYYKFNKSQFDKLFFFFKTRNELISNSKKKSEADNYVSKLHIQALNRFKNKNYEIIGLHGQTIHHSPQKRSVQLGNPYLLSDYFKKKIVYDFRKNDLINGGQGAPLAPIYHKYLIEKNNLELPCVFINIGGISNLTYWDGNQLIGFDVGPGNCLLDDFIKIKLNSNFDFNGNLASKGEINNGLVVSFMKKKYFKTLPPKSLDKNDFSKFFNKFLGNNLSVNDGLATLSEITIKCIINSFNCLPRKPVSMVVCGGGFKNKFLINRLQFFFKKPIINPKFINIDIDFVESELIAFIAARTINKLPITFPKTTGVSKPLTGGVLIKK